MSQPHQFAGKHFCADYTGCIETLSDIDNVRLKMFSAIEASGATLLSYNEHIFTSTNGYTGVFALSESHASIHTYPEINSCFIDLFTCGENCSYEQFDKIMRDFLQPSHVKTLLFRRDGDITIVPDKDHT